MKKFLMVALVLGLVFSMAQVTVADERLKVNGAVRLRALNFNNYHYGYDDTDTKNENYKYFDYRFRLGLEVTVTEGITANFRTDFCDNVKWGDESEHAGNQRPDEDDEMEIDRAYIRIEKDMFIYQGGLIYQSFGGSAGASAYAPMGTGMALRLKLPVIIDLNYFKRDEGSALYDDYDDSATEDEGDADLYGLQVQYEADTFKAGAYYATITDGETDSTDGEHTPNVIGVWGETTIGPVAVKGLLDFFGGSDSSSVDVMGTQLYLNGEMAVTEMVSVGMNAYYALAADSDNTEIQYTELDDRDAPFEPFDKGLQSLGDGLDLFGSALAPGAKGLWSPFDISGDNAGVMAADLYATIKPMDKITLAFLVGYYMPQDDDEDVTDWNSATGFSGSVKYEFAPGCQLVGAASYSTADYDDVDTDAAIQLGALLQVAF